MSVSWLLPLTVFLPWLGAGVVLVAGRAVRLRLVLAIAFAAADAVLSILLIPLASSHVGFSLVLGGAFGELSLLPDAFGVFLAAVAAVIGCLAVIFSVDYMRGEEGQARYYALVLFFIGAMAGLVLSANLLMVVVFWEITALCSWALISFHNDDPKAVAGGIKALIVTGLGGAGLLTSDQPLAITVDTVGRTSLTTYRALPKPTGTAAGTLSSAGVPVHVRWNTAFGGRSSHVSILRTRSRR
jgi:NADH-quinone oxidoreductase subunit L